MKKIYQKPKVEAISIALMQMVTESVNKTEGNAGLEYAGGSNESARSSEYTLWDNWDED